MSSNYIPVYSLNVPNGGVPGKVFISPNTPVYSSYTGELIGYGQIPRNSIMTDAPFGHSRHGKPFHVVVKNPVNDTYMAHRFK